MNAHDRAVREVASIFPPPFTRPHGVIREYLERVSANGAVIVRNGEVFVPDGEVIVTRDGKVASLAEANRHMLEKGTYDDVYTIVDLIDAAREVAE